MVQKSGSLYVSFVLVCGEPSVPLVFLFIPPLAGAGIVNRERQSPLFFFASFSSAQEVSLMLRTSVRNASVTPPLFGVSWINAKRSGQPNVSVWWLLFSLPVKDMGFEKIPFVSLPPSYCHAY